jgi:mannose-6-phosphate isomerase-like protein (cupin superfamily)
MEAIVVADLIAFNPDKMSKNVIFESTHMFYDLYCLKPGQAQKVHVHQGSDKVYFVVAGEGVFTVGDVEARHSAGVAVMARSGEAHGIRNDGPQDLVALVVMTPRP